MKAMIYINNLTEEELKFFNKLQSDFPDNVLVRIDHGFDMSSTVQVVVDITDILELVIPSLIATVELVLMYRIQKRQNELAEKEQKLHRKELLLEQEKMDKNEFEIRVASNGETEIIVKTSDVESLLETPDNLEKYLKEIRDKLSSKK